MQTIIGPLYALSSTGKIKQWQAEISSIAALNGTDPDIININCLVRT